MLISLQAKGFSLNRSCVDHLILCCLAIEAFHIYLFAFLSCLVIHITMVIEWSNHSLIFSILNFLCSLLLHLSSSIQAIIQMLQMLDNFNHFFFTLECSSNDSYLSSPVFETLQKMLLITYKGLSYMYGRNKRLPAKGRKFQILIKLSDWNIAWAEHCGYDQDQWHGWIFRLLLQNLMESLFLFLPCSQLTIKIEIYVTY